jgi:hypothetical protein
VEYIKKPIELFLAAVLKFEPTLGAKVAGGAHRHIPGKLQWHIFMSKKFLKHIRTTFYHLRRTDTLLGLEPLADWPNALEAI